MIRLQRILSQAGVSSRRAGEELIRQGRVTVNGVTVRELGTKADPERDQIKVDGRTVKVAPRRRYILMNKPHGVLSTRSDPQGRPTVLDLLGKDRGYLYPVGRLDFESEGLLLLTNDGELAARLMHPRHGIERVYEARVIGVPDPHTIERLRRGVVIDGRPTAPAVVKLMAAASHRRAADAVLMITLREGRNRQVRRMCEAVGHPVVKLRRVRLGPIADPALKVGVYRELRADEVRRLKSAAGLPSTT